VVVFLTDGMATVGETSPERIADQAERGRGPFASLRSASDTTSTPTCSTG